MPPLGLIIITRNILTPLRLMPLSSHAKRDTAFHHPTNAISLF